MGGSSSRPVLSKDSEAIQLEVNRHPVVVYTKPHCPYCTKAKNELEQDGVVYTEKDLSKDGQATEARVKGLMDLTHCRTVPQIFVCGK
ncbi:glutaredoxin [Oesophagostomum dentatum]|uniref:Glutaredoxin n=1 Tax=Oesophagostomum dentatum TaxID=61180 RepID=A0A0B1T5L9_OESDE|nr:glutaredoxin [Oesophagostomum dentatum]